MNPVDNTCLLVHDLCIRLRDTGRPLVSGVNFRLAAGRCLGIVGESGSGKTLVCRALLGLLPPSLQAEGSVCFEGTDILRSPACAVRALRGTGMAFILQQPMTAFDPLLTLYRQMSATLRERLGLSRADADTLLQHGLHEVNLPENVLYHYPHQLSGGMLQRCMIALTLGMGARLIIADEPTAALDARNQYAVLHRFQQLRRVRQMTLVFVSHDLGAVQMLADDILVMRQGRIVESGTAQSVFNRPQHAYTQHLVRTRLELTRGFQRFLARQVPNSLRHTVRP